MTDPKLVPMFDVIARAYEPCIEFERACAGLARWSPSTGHVPRGYTGAESGIDEVVLVILVAEPGDPRDDPPLSVPDPIHIASTVLQHTRDCFATRRDSFHSNVRYILDLVFPRLRFQDQLAKTWFTNTYLCSAPTEGGRVPADSEFACADRYLRGMLEQLPGRPILALGGKAQRRLRRLRRPDFDERLVCAHAAAPPGAHIPAARPSWECAATRVRLKRQG